MSARLAVAEHNDAASRPLGRNAEGARPCDRGPYTARLVLHTIAGLELVHQIANIDARSGHHILGIMYLYERITSTMPC